MRNDWPALLIIIVSSSPTLANADWFCTDGASQTRGSSILACGSGTASTLQSARDSAREAAIAEFDAICSRSDVCNGFQVVVNPKRTECQTNGSQHTCYRAIEFEIQRTRKENILVDVDAVEEQLRLKRQELEEFSLRYEKLKRLAEMKSATEVQAAELKELETRIASGEGTEIELLDKVSKKSIDGGEYKYTHNLFKNSFKVSGTYFSSNLVGSSEVILGGYLSYEYRPIQYFGLNLSYGFGGDLSTSRVRSNGGVPMTGSANTISSFDGALFYHEVFVGTNIYTGWHGLYFKGEFGRNWASKDRYQVTYGPLGTATSVDKSSSWTGQNMVGFGIGLDSRNDRRGFGGFVEIGGRKSLDRSDGFGITINAGANFGF